MHSAFFRAFFPVFFPLACADQWSDMPHKTSDDPEVRRNSSSSEEARAHTQQRLRRLPSVEWLRRRATMEQAGAIEGQEPDPRLTHVAREILDSARTAIRRGETAPTREELVAATRARLDEARAPYLREVINATGVIVHTNLGRAPLSERAIEQVVAVAHGYSNLEFDLAVGARGSRLAGVRQSLCELTGAEDAIVVNNNAAAVLLTLAALAAGREVIVSRGELVEIGGGFRIPEVLEQSGARLVEVGTTNKTHLRDYEMAITPETMAILSVHPSNFRIVGFTESPPLARIASVAHAAGIHHIHDLGSGALFGAERWGLAHEPTARESLASRRRYRLLFRRQAARRTTGRRDPWSSRVARADRTTPADARGAQRQTHPRGARGYSTAASGRSRRARDTGRADDCNIAGVAENARADLGTGAR